MGRGGKVFLFSLSAPSPSPFDSPQLVRFFAVEYGGVDTGIISADNNTDAPNENACNAG